MNNETTIKISAELTNEDIERLIRDIEDMRKDNVSSKYLLSRIIRAINND